MSNRTGKQFTFSADAPHTEPVRPRKQSKVYHRMERKFPQETRFNRLLGVNVPVVQSRQVSRRIALLEAKVNRQLAAAVAAEQKRHPGSVPPQPLA